jgi:excinuclease ABC subunit A
MIGITGVSGSGKSTLARDIIAKYGVRNYTLTLPAHARKVIADRKIIQVDTIENLPATILIDVVNSVSHPGSVLSTITGIHTLIRELFFRFGKYRCPKCGTSIPDDAPSTESPYLTQNTDEENDGGNAGRFIKCPSCKTVLPRKTMGLFSFNVGHQSGGGACPACNGTGKGIAIDFDKMIVGSLPINMGGIPLINKTGLQYTKVSDKFLEAVGGKYGFSLNSKYSELTEKQKNILINGSEDTIAFQDRQGANGGRKNLRFLGIRAYLQESLQSGKAVKNLEPYAVTGKCPVCNGSRYDPLLKYITIEDKSIDWFLSNTVGGLLTYLKEDTKKDFSSSMSPIIDLLCKKLELFVKAECSYLGLGRASSTLSGGELQRLRLCSFLGEKISGACILLDEPTTGLHYQDIAPMIHILRSLKENRTTVILIEHNPHILKSCDYIVDLGPGGGVNGGQVLFSDTVKNITKYETPTSCILRNDSAFRGKTHAATAVESSARMIRLHDLSANTIKKQSAHFPLNAIVSICGVSGSGKSTFVRDCLVPILSKKSKEYGIDKIENLGQNNSIKSSASSVGSLLGVNEGIAKIFAGASGMEKLCFMINSKSGKCHVCEGKGVIFIEDEMTELCPECGGKMFDEEVLKISIDKNNILDLLTASIEDLIKIKMLSSESRGLFRNCVDIGVGYLSLSRTSKTLSKGEMQRVKLASIFTGSKKNNIYVLDEPTKGLHYADCTRVLDFARRVVENGNTIVAVEHNLDFIRNTDYIIEFGPGAGNMGGQVVFNGTIEGLVKTETATAQALNRPLQKIATKSNTGPSSSSISLSFEKGKTIEFKRNKVNQINVDNSYFFEIFNYSNLAYLRTLFPASTYLTGYVTDKTRLDAVVNLPVVRIVDPDQNLWKRTTRIVDVLNCDREIALLFTGENTNDNQINAFSPGSVAGKCAVCKGAGIMELIPENMLISKGKLLPDIARLLEQTTMYNQATQYLKELYNIDLKKNIEKMTEEEYSMLLFGDRQKKFIHKGKEYYWDGVVKSVISELRHMQPQERRESLHANKHFDICPVCKGTCLKKQYQKRTFMNKTYHSFLTAKVNDIFPLFSLESKGNKTNKLVKVLGLMGKLGLGNASLFSLTQDFDSSQKAMLLLITYLANPIYDSCLAINSKPWIASKSQWEIVNDLLDGASSYCTVIVNRENIHAKY